MEFQRAEMQMRFANITSSPNDLVINSIFHLRVGNFGSNFNICLPYAMVEPIRQTLTNTAMQRADPEEKRARADQMAGEVQRTRVPLTACFTTIESTVGNVQRLQVGDVLPIELPSEVTAHVDDVPVFRATYGRLHDHKALRVTQLINHIPQDISQDNEN
jgi:flagellar motor switch protein FliM